MSTMNFGTNLLHICICCIVFLASSVTTAPHEGSSNKFWEKYDKDDMTKVQNTRTRNWNAKNVILFVGDGFGLSAMVATRIFQGQQKLGDNNIGELNRLKIEERLPFVALSKTFSTSHQVTDSAASAFAMVAGTKTVSGTLGFGGDKVEFSKCGSGVDPLPTIADHFKAEKKQVGVVTTTRVTHATPASLYAKTECRWWESFAEGICKDIATQLIEKQDLFDIILGGGAQSFVPESTKTYFSGNSTRKDSEDLTQKWIEGGGTIVWDKNELGKATREQMPLLGLFADTHLEYESRASKPPTEPTLADMTLKALELLGQGNDNGYFLMVEGGRIDHAQHDNNPYLMLTEADAFDKTIDLVLSKVNLDDTLVIVTADHSHAFAITGYPEINNPILGYHFDERTKTNVATLTYGSGPSNNAKDGPPENENKNFVDNDNYWYPSALKGKDWEGNHGGEDVLILADGPMAHLFQGIRSQTFISAVMQEASCTGNYKRDYCNFNSKINTAKPSTSRINILLFLTTFILLISN